MQEGMIEMSAVAVYTCATGSYDWIHRPKVKPPGIDFLRFSDRKPWCMVGWRHKTLTQAPGAQTPRVISRFPKMCPHAVLKGYDMAVWIDSSVEITGDLRPLIQAFDSSGADVALFPHPSGRTVAEEFDFAKSAGRILPEKFDAAARQRERYAAEGLLDRRIVEATIILYRLSSDALRKAGEIWWEEVTTYVDRDQVSQPYAMQDGELKIHLWDWHFEEDNPYFRRLPHRPKSIARRLKTGAHFLGDSRFDYRLVRSVIRTAGTIRHAGRSLLSRS
jgi:hypothetical protein